MYVCIPHLFCSGPVTLISTHTEQNVLCLLFIHRQNLVTLITH